MNDDLAAKLEELQQGPGQLWREMTGNSPLFSFLFLILLCLLLVILIVRYFLYRSKKLNDLNCPACGGEMKRIHQSSWLRFITPLFSLRSMYCRPCHIRALRLKPKPKRTRLKRRRRQRSSPEPSGY